MQKGSWMMIPEVGLEHKVDAVCLETKKIGEVKERPQKAVPFVWVFLPQ